jgi:hypothetical protein
MIENYALRASVPGDSLQFLANNCFDLKLLKHDWSGMLNIYRDGVFIREIDLYSNVANSTYKEYFVQDLRPHVYTIEVLSKTNPASHGTEVWLDAILERDTCEPVGGSSN